MAFSLQAERSVDVLRPPSRHSEGPVPNGLIAGILNILEIQATGNLPCSLRGLSRRSFAAPSSAQVSLKTDFVSLTIAEFGVHLSFIH